MTDRSFLLSWLTACTLMVALIVVIGGLTRLTESGLSIVEWKPVTGTLPPLSESAWQEEFLHYQQSPQYQKINKGMTLAEFKHIFWLEYAHRLLGRLIGIVFLLPLLYALHKRYVPQKIKKRLWMIFALGGIQGAIGWWMVSSGLINEPRVSPILLAFHLGTAFLIFSLLLWSLLDVLDLPLADSTPDILSIRRAGWALTGLIFLQVLLGALVAGLDAGLTYNTYPLMDGRIIPEGLALLHPAWRNFLENVTTVQFDHRLIAHLLLISVVAFCFALPRHVIDRHVRRLAAIMALALLLQFGLGVATLLSVVAIPLASAHQGGAVMLFALSISLNHRLAQLAANR
jgi:cytochrome c oxidase assembly protein subunit 15